jgi:hypothetical protein
MKTEQLRDELARVIWGVDWKDGDDVTPEQFHCEAQAVIDHLAPMMREVVGALSECDEAMGYMSEYDIPLCMPERVKKALASIPKEWRK